MNQTTVNSDAGSDLKSSAGADEMRKLRSLLEDPVTAVRKLKTGELRREYAHDKAKADICRRWEKKVSLKGPAGLKPFADFLCEISGGLEEMFREPAEIGDLVLDELKAAKESPFNGLIFPKDHLKVIKEWLLGGALENFVSAFAEKGLPVKPWTLPRLSEARELALSQGRDKSSGKDFNAPLFLMTAYALTPSRKIALPDPRVYDPRSVNPRRAGYECVVYESPEDFLKAMRECAAEDKARFAGYAQENRLILEKYMAAFPDPESRAPLPEVLNYLGLAFLIDLDYVSRNSAELIAYIKDLVTRNQVLKLRNFFWFYRIPLKKLQETPGWEDIPATPEEACPECCMDEDALMFLREEDFREYLTDERNRRREKPENYVPFVMRAHARRKVYESIAQKHPSLKPDIDAYFADAFESSIGFGAETFPDVPSLEARLKPSLELFRKCPGDRKNFLREKGAFIKAFSLIPRFAGVMKPFLELAAGEGEPEYLIHGDLFYYNSLEFKGAVLKEVLSDGAKNLPTKVLNFVMRYQSALKEFSKNREAYGFSENMVSLLELAQANIYISLNGNVYDAFSGSGLKPGDTLKFGRCQVAANDNAIFKTQRTMEWQVLDVFDIPGNEALPAGKGPARGALIISRYPVFFREYHNPGTPEGWQSSKLNHYLNHDFLKESFSYTENLRLLDTETGPGTTSRIFCLSIEEAERYFSGNAERACPLFDYGTGEVKENTPWWLRSSGADKKQAAFVAADGTVMGEGCPVKQKLAVRLATRIILDDVIRERSPVDPWSV